MESTALAADDTSSPTPHNTRDASTIRLEVDVATPAHSEDAPISPPFWSHGRTTSNVSYQSIRHLRPDPILLEDHSEEDHDSGKACWARHVNIDDYVVVSGPTGIGSYVVWNVTIETLKGGPLTIRKRYSEFDELRTNLVRAFPHAEASIPRLPRKSVISRFRAKFLEHRKAGLFHFLNCVLLNPEFSSSPIVKDFIFS